MSSFNNSILSSSSALASTSAAALSSELDHHNAIFSREIDQMVEEKLAELKSSVEERVRAAVTRNLNRFYTERAATGISQESLFTDTFLYTQHTESRMREINRAYMAACMAARNAGGDEPVGPDFVYPVDEAIFCLAFGEHSCFTVRFKQNIQVAAGAVVPFYVQYSARGLEGTHNISTRDITWYFFDKLAIKQCVEISGYSVSRTYYWAYAHSIPFHILGIFKRLQNRLNIPDGTNHAVQTEPLWNGSKPTPNQWTCGNKSPLDEMTDSLFTSEIATSKTSPERFYCNSPTVDSILKTECTQITELHQELNATRRQLEQARLQLGLLDK